MRTCCIHRGIENRLSNNRNLLYGLLTASSTSKLTDAFSYFGWSYAAEAFGPYSKQFIMMMIYNVEFNPQNHQPVMDNIRNIIADTNIILQQNELVGMDVEEQTTKTQNHHAKKKKKIMIRS